MDLRELYQDLIVDHNRSPRNFGRLDAPDRQVQGFNPLCGDKLTVYLELRDDKIEDIRFEGSGCAISVASASLMTEALKGRTLAEARALFDRVHGLLTGSDEPDIGSLGKIAVLSGVRQFPSRVKCASLCWHAANAALTDSKQTVTTE